MGVWTYVQEGISRNTDTLTMGNPSPVGNILVGGVIWGNTAPGGFSEAGGNGIGGTAGIGNGPVVVCQGLYIVVSNPGIISLTATGMTTDGTIILIEFNPGGGVITAGTAAGKIDNDPNSMISGNITLPAIPSLVVAGGAMEMITSNVTFPAGYTMGPVGANDGTAKGAAFAYNLSETTSPIAPVFGYTGNGVWALVSASFKSVGGGNGITGTLIMNSTLLSKGGGGNLLVVT